MEKIVNIRRSGNVLEVEPACLGVLHTPLTYKHAEMGNMYGMQSGKREVHIVEKEMYRMEGDKLYTLQGALVRVTKALTDAGYTCVFTDLRTKKELEPDYEWFAKCMPDLEFRFKQDEVLATLIGKNCGQIEAPTAYGKTFIMLALAALYPKANIIIAAPSTALLRGTYRRMLKITPDIGRVGAGYNDPQRITLCTFNSILSAPIDKCDILLLDEVHKASSPVMSTRIAKIRTPIKIFGMTATPTGRSDNAHLPIEIMVGPRIAKVDYDEAVTAGIISPIKVVLTDVEDHTCNAHSYDYVSKIAKKRNCYWRNNVRNAKFAEAVSTYPAKLGMRPDAQMLVLTETVEHAFRLAKLLPDFTVIYAGMPAARAAKLKSLGLIPQDYKPLTNLQRDNLLRDFECGVLRKAIATSCWGEGVDFVHLDVLVNVSGATSKISTVQWAGRNSRMYEGKSFGLVIDCIDSWDKWANGRANSRLTTYRKKKWELLKGATL